MKRMTTAILMGLLALTTGASAATSATGTNTIAPKMNMTVNIQKAVSLTLKTGNAAVAHCAVTGAGGGADYNMDFGTVDALGINGGNCNKINPANPGVDNAIYWSDYQISPVFTSHTASSSTTVTAQVTTDFGGSHNVFVVRDALNSSAVPAAATDFTAMGTSSADSIGGSPVTSGSALTRFIGVAVKPDNNNTVLQGSQTATVTFTLTVF